MNEINQINISGVDYDIISNSAENKIRELETKINNIPEGDAVAWKKGPGKIVALDGESTISIGTGTYIEGGVSIGENVFIPDNWYPGAGSSGECLWTKGNNDSVVCGTIKIGSDVQIGTDGAVSIHGPIYISELSGIQTVGGICIGTNVYIEAGFDSRNITSGSDVNLGSPLWIQDRDNLICSNLDVIIQSGVRIGSNSEIHNCCISKSDGIAVDEDTDNQILINGQDGILIGSRAYPTLQIGTGTQIGPDVYIPNSLQFESDDQGLRITDLSKQKSIQLNWTQ